jgi:hypothetical protein
MRGRDPARLAAIPLSDRRWAMPTDFWESLRLGFMQLRESCAINPPIAPAGRLTAIWTAEPAPGNWRLNYWSDTDGSGVAKRFEWHPKVRRRAWAAMRKNTRLFGSGSTESSTTHLKRTFAKGSSAPLSANRCIPARSSTSVVCLPSIAGSARPMRKPHGESEFCPIAGKERRPRRGVPNNRSAEENNPELGLP